MVLIEIERIEKNQYCIAGKVKVFEDGGLIFECYSLENPEIGTEREEDLAIPEGEYTLDRRYSPRFSKSYSGRDMFWIYNDVIPKDAYILFHGGNTTEDTDGCILLGQEFTKEGSAISGLGYGSKATTTKFMDILEGKSLEGAKVIISNKF